MMLKHMERLRQRRRRLQTRAAAAAAEEEEAALKVVEETGVAKEIEASSSLSSGDDELNDNRNNFTSSPLVEASLMVEAFHFFGAQHSKESKPSSTSWWKNPIVLVGQRWLQSQIRCSYLSYFCLILVYHHLIWLLFNSIIKLIKIMTCNRHINVTTLYDVIINLFIYYIWWKIHCHAFPRLPAYF